MWGFTFRNRSPAPLLQLPSSLHIRMQHAPGGIGQPHLSLSTALLLQELAHTRKCPTRTRSTCESVQVSMHLFPDLRTRGFVVGPRVGDIIELIRPHGVGEIFSKGLRLVVVVPWVLVCHSWDWVDFGPKHPEEVDLFLTLEEENLGFRNVGDLEFRWYIPECSA